MVCDEMFDWSEHCECSLCSMERRGDWLLSSLRRYVAALGGELEVVARFGDKSVHLHVPEDGEAQHA